MKYISYYCNKTIVPKKFRADSCYEVFVGYPAGSLENFSEQKNIAKTRETFLAACTKGVQLLPRVSCTRIT